jgi:SAM-dependent methyltransferase
LGNKDNVKVPEGVEDLRPDTGDIHWIIEAISHLDLLITPQSGPCFIAAGWGIPMWVYRSRQAYWDYTLNFDVCNVQRWWERKKDYTIFDELYRAGGWDGKGSGPGSEAEANQEYLWILHKILRYTPSIKTVLDIGCGDWQHMQHVDLDGKEYLGVDVSPYVIESNKRKFSRPGVSFQVSNPILEDFPQVDLIIIKDVLQHLPNADIATVLKKIRERSRFALIINDYTDLNRGDISVGEYRPVNVLLEPFNHPGLTIFGYIGKQVVLGIQ